MSTFTPLQYKLAKTTPSVTQRATVLRPQRGIEPPQVSSISEQGSSSQRQDASGFTLAHIPIDEPVQTPRNTSEQHRGNNTGLPDKLKAGIESLSGLSMDDVQVHYNLSKPAQLQALAYTQGAEIHVGPGQERHLPHEAWHVAQQKQERVKPTLQIRGRGINDDEELEEEADRMGSKAGKGHLKSTTQLFSYPLLTAPTLVIQRKLSEEIIRLLEQKREEALNLSAKAQLRKIALSNDEAQKIIEDLIGQEVIEDTEENRTEALAILIPKRTAPSSEKAKKKVLRGPVLSRKDARAQQKAEEKAQQKPNEETKPPAAVPKQPLSAVSKQQRQTEKDESDPLRPNEEVRRYLMGQLNLNSEDLDTFEKFDPHFYLYFGYDWSEPDKTLIDRITTDDKHWEALIERLQDNMLRAPGGGSSGSGGWATSNVRKEAKQIARDPNYLQIFPSEEYTIHHKISRNTLAKLYDEMDKRGRDDHQAKPMWDFLHGLKAKLGTLSEKKALLNLPANLEVGPPADRRNVDPGSKFDPNQKEKRARGLTFRSENLQQVETLIIKQDRDDNDWQKMATLLTKAQEKHEAKVNKQKRSFLSNPLTGQWEVEGTHKKTGEKKFTRIPVPE